MVKIPVLDRNKFIYALVDKKDYSHLSQFSWYALHSNNDKIYAARYLGGKTILMHNDILQDNDFQIDHIDNNGLNNHRKNLRLATASQNSMHQGKKSGMYSSTYKGVSWRTSRERWVARITIDQNTRYIGSFLTEIDAAMAYDVEAKRIFGDFAVLNCGES